jgi:hypothetical protein
MRRFIQKLILFLLPFVAGIGYLFLGPFDKDYGYDYMLESCGKRDFLYHRIFEDPTPVDVAFLGSSQTMCGLNDSLLEVLLSERIGKKTGVANLGFCRPGRSLHYAILKDLLKKHTPHLVIIEVRDKEDRFSHPDFPFIADPVDLFFPVFFFNQRYPESLVDAAECRFNYRKSRMLKYPQAGTGMEADHRYGFIYSELIADTVELKRRLEKKVKSIGRVKGNGFFSEIEDRITYRFPRETLKRTVRLAENAGVQVRFLYMRPYGSPVAEPGNLDLYLQLAPVLHPPDSLFLDPAAWLDFEHVNGPGAKALTEWLAEKLADSEDW